MARKRDSTFSIFASDETKQAFKDVKGNLGSLTRLMKTGAGLLGFSFGIDAAQRLIMVSDNLRALQIRVRTATKDTGDHVAVWEQLRDVAQTTGAELTTAVSTFQDLSRVKVVVGATNDDIIALTRTVNQLGVIGGSTTEQLRFGMRQFNQAMSQPFFRAEEFNSLLENIPEVAARIAAGFRMDQGALRQLVIEGKLSSKEVFDVLLRQSGEISEEFKNIPLTVGRASSEAGTSISTMIRDLDEQIGATKFLASWIEDHIIMLNPTVGNVTARFDRLNSELHAVSSTIEAMPSALDDMGNVLDGRLNFRLSILRLQERELISEIEELLPAYEAFRKMYEAAQKPKKAESEDDFAKRLHAVNEAALAEFGDALTKSAKEVSDTEKLIEQSQSNHHKVLLAQALGYVDEKDRATSERELELRAAGNQLLMAQDAGFTTIQAQAEHDQDEQRESARTNRAEQAASKRHQILLAQALGFLDEDAEKTLERELQLRERANELILAQAEGFKNIEEQKKAEQDLRQQEDLYRIEEQKATGRTREEELELEHQQRMRDIAVETYGERFGLNDAFLQQMRASNDFAHRMDIASTRGKFALMTAAGVEFAGAFAGNSERMLKLQKNLALANIAITLPPAIIETFKSNGGWPGGIIPAALMAAEGMRQIQAVRSAGSGGRVSSPGGGGGGGVPSMLPSPPPQMPQVSQPTTRLVVQILGDIVSAQEFGDRVVKIVQERTDADEIFITAGSAQAREIRG